MQLEWLVGQTNSSPFSLFISFQGPELVWALSSSLPRFSHNYSLSVTCSSGNAQTSCRKLEKLAKLREC